MRNTKDIIQQKQTKLETLQKISNNALDIVNSTINNLTSVNEEIDNTIAEIEDAKEKLNSTEKGLYDQKGHNSRIINRFKALIDDDKEN